MTKSKLKLRNEEEFALYTLHQAILHIQMLKYCPVTMECFNKLSDLYLELDEKFKEKYGCYFKYFKTDSTIPK
jgi:hypothetical protein